MSIRILTGDCREVLSTLPDASVNCVVTSPPYFGLRDYGVDGQIGLEPDPETYVSTLVEVFQQVRRVLRNDGTVWLNLGSSYVASGGNRASQFRPPQNAPDRAAFVPANVASASRQSPQSSVPDVLASSHTSACTCGTETTSAPSAVRTSDMASSDLACGCGSCGICWANLAIPLLSVKSKDLLNIPALVALALQADGWWLRSDVIWHKPNPMPESVTDRPTSAHEHVFLLAKSERYYFDADAVKETASANSHGALRGDPGQKARTTGNHSGPLGLIPDDGTRNIRNVWTVATQPFSECHFATFPPALVEPCIKAGCPEGGTVLDPFGGAGTTGLVADRLKRNAILIELNPEYAAMAKRRIEQDAGMFAKVDAV